MGICFKCLLNFFYDVCVKQFLIVKFSFLFVYLVCIKFSEIVIIDRRKDEGKLFDV